MLPDGSLSDGQLLYTFNQWTSFSFPLVFILPLVCNGSFFYINPLVDLKTGYRTDTVFPFTLFNIIHRLTIYFISLRFVYQYFNDSHRHRLTVFFI